MPARRKKRILARHARAFGSGPEISIESGRVVPEEGQIWALTDHAGMPNRLIYILGGSGHRLSSFGISDEPAFASSADFILNHMSSPVGFALVIEPWNSLEIAPRLLDHWVGTLCREDIQAVRNMAAGRTSGHDPIRWPGDPRIEFQAAERRRYAPARRVSLFDVEKLIHEVTVQIPAAGNLDLETEEPSGRLRMAAKTVLSPSAVLRLYRQVLNTSALRVAVAVWADDSIGIATETNDSAFTAVFTSLDGTPLTVEPVSNGGSFRLWKIIPSPALRQEGFEVIFHVIEGLMTLVLRPGDFGGQEPTVQEFGRHLQRFSAGGAGLPQMLRLISDCRDGTLRYLFEEEVKRIVRLGRHHPSWRYVFTLIRASGSENLWKWARQLDEQ